LKNVFEIIQIISPLQESEYHDALKKHGFTSDEISEALKVFATSGIDEYLSETFEKAAKGVMSSFDVDAYINKQIDTWTVTDTISTTKKGIVLKAEPNNGDFNQTVAIKIQSPLYDSKNGVSHVRKQANFMSTLDHPNVVKVYASGTTSCGSDYLAMEYVNGGNVVKYCSTNKLTLQNKISLFIDICSGVAHLHDHTVTHGDLKPGNILVNKKGIPKIIDFDLSTVSDASFHEGQIYEDLLGLTKQYASPERLGKSLAGDALSDIYSLGQILIELLTESNNTTDWAGDLAERYCSVKSIVELISIIEKSTCSPSTDRYQTVVEFADDLRCFIDGRYIPKAHLLHSTKRYSLIKLVKRRWVMMVTSFALMILVVSFTVSTVQQKEQVRQTKKLMIQSQDPRNDDSWAVFGNKAAIALENCIEIDELMDYGHAYYGSGQARKSVAFYEKIISLLPDKGDRDHLIAASSLLVANYALGRKEEVKKAVTIYSPYLFTDSIIDPFLIRITLEFGRTMERYNWLEWSESWEGEKPPRIQDILKRIDLSNIKEDDIRNELEAFMILHHVSVKYYYDLDGDQSSVLVYKNEDELKETMLALGELKLSLLKAIKIYTDLSGVSADLAKSYLWLGKIEHELREFEMGDFHLNKGVELTRRIYGEQHTELSSAYLKSYSVNRYRNPELALEYARKAFDIRAKINLDSGESFIFEHEIYIAATVVSGDWQKAHVLFKKMADIHNSYTGNPEEIATQASSASMHLQSLISFDEEQADYVIEQALNMEEYFKVLYPEDNYYDVYLAAKHIREGKAHLAEDLLVKGFERSKTSTNLPGDVRATTTLMIAEQCVQIPHCETLPMADYVKKVMTWSSIDSLESNEKAEHHIRLAEVYRKLGKHDSARSLLLDVTAILDIYDKKTHVLVGLWHYVMMKSHLDNGKILLAKQQATKALEPAMRNFSLGSSITQEIMKTISTIAGD